MKTTILLITIALAGCSDGPCTMPPCPLGAALSLTIRSAGSGHPSVTATVAVSGAFVTTQSCAGACTIFGGPGSYVLDVTAPGFAPAHRTITVSGTSPKCSCGSTQTVAVAIELIPIELGAPAI